MSHVHRLEVTGRGRLAPRLGLVLAALAGLSPAVGAQETIFGMTAANSGSASPGLSLVTFSSATPGTQTTIGAFSGVTAGHAVRSIDFRPATGELYAISTSTTDLAAAQLYTVNLTTAALTPVGSGFSLGTNNSARVEIDFNPVVDRIRIMTGANGAANNNFRANPNDGTLVATDTNLAFVAGDPLAGQNPSIIGGAYTNNVPGATTTTLYAWDFNSDALVTVGGVGGTPSPNDGALNTVNNPPGFLTFNAALGMDISGATGILYVSHDDPATGTSMSLYTRDLATGAETLLGAYGTGVFIVDITVVPVPEPTGVLAVVAGAGLVVRRLRRRA